MNTTQNHTVRLAYSAGNAGNDFQSYNRYAYVMNNPMKFTDPSGYVSYGATLGNLYDPMYGLHYYGQMGRITEMGYTNDYFKDLEAFWALFGNDETKIGGGIGFSSGNIDGESSIINTGGSKNPYITNNSKYIIYFKPETSYIVNGIRYYNDGAYPLKPGESWYYPIDGLSVPHIELNQVLKIINGIQVTVGNSDYDLNYPNTSSIFIQFFRGGWKGQSWIDGLNSPTVSGYIGMDPPVLFKTIDTSWNNLFLTSKIY
jgi:hypothetical protein